MVSYLPYLLSLGLVTPQFQEVSGQIKERTGPFKTVYAWKQLDYEFLTEADRTRAISNKEYVPENNLPLGVEVYGDRLFISVPKWKLGVPASLTVLPKVAQELDAKLKPYPNWGFHNSGCQGLTSVYRMEADECGRLWVIDSGQTEALTNPQQPCPPQLFIFDLTTDKLILRYQIPEEFIKQDSLFTNVKVDIRNQMCDDAYAYMPDVWRFGLLVFSLKQMKSWKITDHLFFPDPLASAYHLHGLDFEWTDGIFGLSLSPHDLETNERLLYFHPMSSFREFSVKTSVIRNETGWSQVKDPFVVLGQSRGRSGHASTSGIDRNGIMFFNLVTRDSIGCWDTRKPYTRSNLGVIAQSNLTLVFPNDLKIDQEQKQSLWVLSNRLPFYLYSTLNPNETNFRILTAFNEDAIKQNVCNPNVLFSDNLNDFEYNEECY